MEGLLILKLYKYNIEKCITKDEIKESLQLINNSETDFITPTGKVYRYYKQINKYFPVTIAINDHNGYLYVNINYKHKKGVSRRLHILVAEAYVYNPDPDNLLLVGHKDNDKTNDNFYNLYWTNNQENVLKAVKDGLLINKTGIENKDSFPVKVVDLHNNLVSVYGSIRECCRYIKNLNVSYLSKVLTNKKDYKPRNKKYKYFKITKEEYDSIDNKYKNLELIENEKMKKQNRIFKAINLKTKEEFISDNQKKFGKEHNIPQANISYCLIHNVDYHKTWRFEIIKDINYTESSGYNNLIKLSNDVIIENIKTNERKIFKTIKELKDFLGLQGHDIRQYIRSGYLIMSKWKIIQI